MLLTTACEKTLLVFSSVIRGQMIINSTTQNNPQLWYLSGFPGGASGKEPSCQCRRWGFDPWVRKILWKRKWQPTQYSCLENLVDRGAWRATVHSVAKSRTWLKWLSTHMVQLKKSWMGVDVDFCTWLTRTWPCSLRGVSKPALNKSDGCGWAFFFLEASILQISDPISLFPCWSQILIFYSHPGLPLHTSLNKV